MPRFVLLLLLLPLAGQLAGQELSEKSFDLYTTASGLSNNTVTATAQDQRGYVWVTTIAGLNRFNGSSVVQFHSNDDSTSLASEELNGMQWLDDHRLAVFTTGLQIIDTRTGKTRNVFIPYHNRNYQFKFNMVARVKGEKNGSFYVLTRSGFYHYDKDYRLIFRYDYYNDAQVPVTHFYFGSELLEPDSRHLILVTAGGLFTYDRQLKEIKKMTPKDNPLFAEFIDYPSTNCLFFQQSRGHFLVMKTKSDTVVYLDYARKRKIISQLPVKPLRNEFHWRSNMTFINDTVAYVTSHSSGFFRIHFNPHTGKVTFHPKKYFASYLCTSLLNDKENNLWIGTTRGLLRQNTQRSQVSVLSLPPGVEDSFPNVRMDDIYLSDDKIYLGTRGEAGLFVVDKKTMTHERQILFTGNRNLRNHIRGITSTDASTLLIATNGPLLLFDRNKNKEKLLLPPRWDIENDWTSDILKDSKGRIWISSANIYRFDPVTRQFALIPFHERLLAVPSIIEEDREGHMWMAGHGIARYNTRLGQFDIVIDSFPFIKMPDKQINALLVDPFNRVWFNANNNGLTVYDPAKKTFRLFTKKDGLPDDNIAALKVVGNQLWIACFSGLACMDLSTSKIIGFGKEEGFPDMPIAKGPRIVYDSVEKKLYVGFITAVAVFDPHEIIKKKSPPQLFVESLVINSEFSTFLPQDRITTSWKDNEVRITIGTINFSDGNSQRFAYRVFKDSASPWIQLGSQPTFSISNLSPGTHRIQIKVYSPNNRWPEQVREMVISVTPPLWKKDWFVALMMVLGILGIYLLIKWRTGLARRKEMEKTHLEKLKADDYKNQFELEQISNYFSSSLADKKNEEEVLWDVAQNLIGRMNYVDCMIYLWNEDKTKMVQKAAYGPKGKPEFIYTQVFDVVPGQGIVGHVMETRQPVLLTDTRTDSRYRVDDDFRLSEVCVPIIHDDELLGIIDSEHPDVNYFSERDIKILTTIATLVGNKLKQIESEQTIDAKRKELATINEQLAEARLSALQAQMNPHFVFNALNSIKRMILDEDNEKASRYLSKFALMIRMTLDHSKDVFVTLEENIRYLKAYLEMEQLRFDDSFTYNIQIGDTVDLSETTIPSMMIQPLVENAIWHGLMQAEHEKKILISFTQDENTLTCTVEDNGIGIRQSERLKKTARPTHNSVGLENLQKRIKIINEKFDMDCHLVITDLKETGSNSSGTRVVLQFNLINV